MQIQYFGLTSFKITTKDKTLIIDPFSKESGLTPPRGNADLVILSEETNPIYSYTQSLSGDPFIVNGPGEYDVRDHTIDGIPIQSKDSKRVITAYLIEAEGIRILDLAHIKKLDISQEELEDLGDIDILFVPVGGEEVMDYETAAKAVNLVEPKIVIPTHYKMSGLKVSAETEEKFLKELGNKFDKMDKLTIKKKDLIQENVQVVVLEPLR
jgi:L-ascorbate metabolism protein UlaG (beta-lactamase superfamily)